LLWLEIKQQNDISKQILLNYNNIGLCYNGLNEYNKAQDYFKYVIDNCNDCDNNYIIDSNYGLGKAYYGLKAYDRALEYFTISNDMAKEANHTQTIANSHLYIAKIHYEFKKYNLSLMHLKNSEKISKKYNFIHNQRENYQLLSKIYQKLGNYKKALEYNNAFISFKDSIMSEGLIQNLKDIYVEFQKSQSDEIIAGKDNVIQRGNQFMIMLGIILMLMIVILTFAYRTLSLRSRLNKKLDSMVQVKTRELSSTNIQLVKSRNELDSFLYRTSHDIRGPIATLLGLTSLAKLETKDNLMSSYLDKINITAEKLNEIISRLTNVSQINSQPLNIEDLNLFNTINEVIDDLKPERKGVSFKLAGPPPYKIKTDKILFKIILENLLENSFKFSDNIENTPFVELDIRQNGNLEFTVTDNGVGIEPEYKDKIFDLFFIAHEKDRGSGIGLYQTMLATQKLKGQVELIKNKKPTQFKVTFPDASNEIIPQQENDDNVQLIND
jgi:signal transduction histidine kinase